MADRLELARTEELHGMPSTLDLRQRELALPRGLVDERTFNIGSGVFRIRTAHWINVVGEFSTGTTGSGCLGVDEASCRCDRSGGGGGGSANSAAQLHDGHFTQ